MGKITEIIMNVISLIGTLGDWDISPSYELNCNPFFEDCGFHNIFDSNQIQIDTKEEEYQELPIPIAYEVYDSDLNTSLSGHLDTCDFIHRYKCGDQGMLNLRSLGDLLESKVSKCRHEQGRDWSARGNYASLLNMLKAF